MGGTRKLIGATPVLGADGKPELDATGQPKVTGGERFDFFMMPASVSVGVQVTLAGVATPAIMAMMDAAGKSQAEQAAALGVAAGSFFTALGTLGEEKVNKVIATLFKYVRVVDPDPERAAGGPNVNIDLDFIGKPKLMWQVVAEALKTNLGDFFPTASRFHSRPRLKSRGHPVGEHQLVPHGAGDAGPAALRPARTEGRDVRHQRPRGLSRGDGRGGRVPASIPGA